MTNSKNSSDSAPFNSYGYLEQMPHCLLPKPFADMSESIVQSARVPPSLAGCCVLGALSASIGSGLSVRSGPDRRSYANLYILASASSGSGKSEAFRHAFAPFLNAELEMIDYWNNETFPKVLSEKHMLECEIEKLKREARSKKSTLNREEIRSAIQEHQKRIFELEIDLNEPAYSTEDATSEGLAKLLNNPRQTLASLSSDSGAIINNLFGRYNNSGRTDESIYLKAWSGDRCKVNRIQRPPIILNQPRMTTLWLVQPDKIDSLLSEKAFVEGGLIPRFLVCHTNAKPSPIPEEEFAIDKQIKDRYSRATNALLRAFRNRRDQSAATPTKDAKRRLRAYYNHVAERMSNGDLKDIAPFAARWAEQAWRISLCIHAGEHLDHAESIEITQETAIKAIQIAEWFSQQQLKVLGSLRRQQAKDRCDKLSQLLKSYNGKLSFRNLDNSHGFKRLEINQLTKDYPNMFEALKEASGGRPSEILRLKS